MNSKNVCNVAGKAYIQKSEMPNMLPDMTYLKSKQVGIIKEHAPYKVDYAITLSRRCEKPIG